MATEATVIVGAGIIGLSTAYFLTQPPSRTPPRSIHIIDSSPALFASASGYAGGFLARDWFDSATAPLGALSFDLHKELAEEHNGKEKWGYRKSKSFSLSNAKSKGSRGDDWLRSGGSRATAATESEDSSRPGPDWLSQNGDHDAEAISTEGTTAQVDPRSLCQFLHEQCVDRGVKVEHPVTVLSVSTDLRGELATVRLAFNDERETDIPCTRLVLTAGVWTPRVFKTLFPTSTTELPITSLAGHSVVVRVPKWADQGPDQECHSVFSTAVDGFSPEYFSRAGGEIYVAGLNDAGLSVPTVATDAHANPASISKLIKVTANAMGLPEKELEVLRQGLCFRPVGPEGPLVCRISDSQLGSDMKTRGGDAGGVFLGAGHGPWGISQSLGTGKVLADLIEDRKSSANIDRLQL